MWWNGAAADRLLDERHAGVLERAIAVVRSRTFLTASEVTYSEFGERGSIDLLAGHTASGCALVGEVKVSLGSLEETNRTLDVKERLAPQLVRARFGWTPRSVSRVLILPDDRTIRRIIDRHAETMAVVYPARSREFRSWLRDPTGRISAIWFLSQIANRDRVNGYRGTEDAVFLPRVVAKGPLSENEAGLGQRGLHIRLLAAAAELAAVMALTGS